MYRVNEPSLYGYSCQHSITGMNIIRKREKNDKKSIYKIDPRYLSVKMEVFKIDEQEKKKDIYNGRIRTRVYRIIKLGRKVCKMIAPLYPNHRSSARLETIIFQSSTQAIYQGILK